MPTRLRRKPGERALGVPRNPRVPYTPEEKAQRQVKREENMRLREENLQAVARVQNPDPLILPAKVQRAIEYWLDMPVRDYTKTVEKAAALADIDIDILRRYWKQPPVREIIDKKLEQIDLAAAEMRARARVLTEDHLDAATLDILQAELVAVGAHAKVKMIEVGYRRFGMLRDKVEATGAGGAPLAFQIVRIGQKKEDDGTGNVPSS